MLSAHPLKDPLKRNEILAGFDPDKDIWVVSDLRTKLQIQDKLLEQKNQIPAQSVIRISELWETLLSRVHPQYRMVSMDYIQILIRDYLDTQDEEWLKAPGASLLLFRYVTQLMPILCHENGPLVMSEWFAENPESFDRWGGWYLQSLKFWKYLLDMNLVCGQWLGGVLYNVDDFPKMTEGKIVVDIGADILSHETSIIEKLARNHNIEVYIPRPKNSEIFSDVLKPYRSLLEIKVNESDFRLDSSHLRSVETRRFPTMLAEAKDATATVREWIDDGLNPANIAVIAPDIGMYWPVLREYFDVEGIASDRPTSINYLSLPEIQQWLSFMRVKLNDYNFFDLKSTCFSDGGNDFGSYEKF